MSDTKFTPGPWNVERPYGEPGLYVAAKSTALVAKLYEERDANEQRRGFTAEANARLIAAAPDLYAACRAILAADDLIDDAHYAAWDKATDMIRAALTKAEGNAPKPSRVAPGEPDPRD